MSVELDIQDPRWETIDLQNLADLAEAATLAHLGVNSVDCEMAVLACDDTRISVLNAEFRGKPQPTNVLSWPAAELAAKRAGRAPEQPTASYSGEIELGDIAIAYDTCEREAREAEKPFADHVLHLLVHGMLHLLGYDHIRDADATLMEGLETAILGKLGVDDPYREDQGN